LYIYV